MTKMALIIMPVAMFVSSGFEHSIANMFMIPLGIAIYNFAPAEFWSVTGLSASAYADLTVSNFLFANLIPVTLGNIVGGAGLVGLANWAIYHKPEVAQVRTSSVTHLPQLAPSKGGEQIDQSILVKDFMDKSPVVLLEKAPIGIAMDRMLEANVSGAPVCDHEDNLVGFVSAHDVMVELWCKEYNVKSGQRVGDLMVREVLAVNASDRLLDVAEFLCIDKEQLYPSTSSGVITTMSSASLEERARSMRVNKPHTLPVLEDGKFVGVLSHQHILKAMRPMYETTAQVEGGVEAVGA